MGKFKKKASRELQRKQAENKLQAEPEQVWSPSSSPTQHIVHLRLQDALSGFAKAAKRTLKREMFLQSIQCLAFIVCTLTLTRSLLQS